MSSSLSSDNFEFNLQQVFNQFLLDLEKNKTPSGVVYLDHPFDYRLASLILERFNSLPNNRVFLANMVTSPVPVPPGCQQEVIEGHVTSVNLRVVPGQNSNTI